jgi:hypothetical protein
MFPKIALAVLPFSQISLASVAIVNFDDLDASGGNAYLLSSVHPCPFKLEASTATYSIPSKIANRFLYIIDHLEALRAFVRTPVAPLLKYFP